MTNDLKSLPDLREAVETLDVLMAQAFGGNQEILPAWFVVKQAIGQVRLINQQDLPAMLRRQAEV